MRMLDWGMEMLDLGIQTGIPDTHLRTQMSDTRWVLANKEVGLSLIVLTGSKVVDGDWICGSTWHACLDAGISHFEVRTWLLFLHFCKSRRRPEKMWWLQLPYFIRRSGLSTQSEQLRLTCNRPVPITLPQDFTKMSSVFRRVSRLQLCVRCLGVTRIEDGQC